MIFDFEVLSQIQSAPVLKKSALIPFVSHRFDNWTLIFGLFQRHDHTIPFISRNLILWSFSYSFCFCFFRKSEIRTTILNIPFSRLNNAINNLNLSQNFFASVSNGIMFLLLSALATLLTEIITSPWSSIWALCAWTSFRRASLVLSWVIVHFLRLPRGFPTTCSTAPPPFSFVIRDYSHFHLFRSWCCCILCQFWQW